MNYLFDLMTSKVNTFTTLPNYYSAGPLAVLEAAAPGVYSAVAHSITSVRAK